MGTQHLLNNTEDSSKFATRKWSVVNHQNNTKRGEGNENESSIKL